MTEVVIFGGSFNPPHIGHTFCIAYALQYIPHLIVVPAWRHQLKDYQVSFEDRFAMCKLAFSWLPGVECSSIEKDIQSDGKMLHTLQEIKKEYPKRYNLRLLVGSDILEETDRWHQWKQIKKIAPPMVVDRGTLTPNLSSSEIRDSLDKKALHPKVLEYIRQYKLYEENNGTYN